MTIRLPCICPFGHSSHSQGSLYRCRLQGCYSEPGSANYWCTDLVQHAEKNLIIYSLEPACLNTMGLVCWGRADCALAQVQLHSAGAFSLELSKWGKASHYKEHAVTCKENCKKSIFAYTRSDDGNKQNFIWFTGLCGTCACGVRLRLCGCAVCLPLVNQLLCLQWELLYSWLHNSL